MNFLKKGPELKLSALKDLKVPGFVQDVYYDLKDRHLLPVAVILIVAMIAVPIAVGDSGSGQEATPGGTQAPGATISGGMTETGALVAKSAPGLRRYERRLEGLRATNPFKQKFEQESASAGDSGTGVTETSASGEPTYTEPSFTEPSYTAPSTETDSGGSEPDRLTHYSYAIDVRITGGTGSQSKSTVRRNLPALTMLPSRETPAIVYMGSTKDGKKAVMTVSSDVQSIFGDGRCVLGSESCQLLAMETGLPETFVYGGAEKTYKIEVLKIEMVETDKLNKAPLGNPKKGKDKSKRSSLAGFELLP